MSRPAAAERRTRSKLRRRRLLPVYWLWARRRWCEHLHPDDQWTVTETGALPAGGTWTRGRCVHCGLYGHPPLHVEVPYRTWRRLNRGLQAIVFCASMAVMAVTLWALTRG